MRKITTDISQAKPFIVEIKTENKKESKESIIYKTLPFIITILSLVCTFSITLTLGYKKSDQDLGKFKFEISKHLLKNRTIIESGNITEVISFLNSVINVLPENNGKLNDFIINTYKKPQKKKLKVGFLVQPRHKGLKFHMNVEPVLIFKGKSDLESFFSYTFLIRGSLIMEYHSNLRRKYKSEEFYFPDLEEPVKTSESLIYKLILTFDRIRKLKNKKNISSIELELENVSKPKTKKYFAKKNKIFISEEIETYIKVSDNELFPIYNDIRVMYFFRDDKLIAEAISNILRTAFKYKVNSPIYNEYHGTETYNVGEILIGTNLLYDELLNNTKISKFGD